MYKKYVLALLRQNIWWIRKVVLKKWAHPAAFSHLSSSRHLFVLYAKQICLSSPALSGTVLYFVVSVTLLGYTEFPLWQMQDLQEFAVAQWLFSSTIWQFSYAGHHWSHSAIDLGSYIKHI